MLQLTQTCLQFTQTHLLDVQLAEATQAREAAEQEAAYLQQDVDDADAAHQDAVRWSQEHQQAREDAEEACTDLQQELRNASAARAGAVQFWEEERQAREHAESEVASLQQQLQQAGVARRVAVAALKLEMKEAELHAATHIQVCFHQRLGCTSSVEVTSCQLVL